VLVTDQSTVFVHPVQAAAVDEGERAALLDQDAHAIRQLAHDLGAAHFGQRLHARDDGGRVQAPEVDAERNGGGLGDPLQRHAGGAADLDGADGEVLRGERPRGEREGRRQQHSHAGRDTQRAEGRPGAAGPAPARCGHPLAADQRRALPEVGEGGRSGARREEASTHR